MSSISSDKESELSKMKVTDLKKELKLRGLSVEGKKHELVERLQSAVSDSSLLDDNVDLGDHDELLDDELTDDEPLDSVISKEEMNLLELKSDTTSPTSKRLELQPKKVILKRNTFSIDNSESPEKENDEKNSDGEQKVIKLEPLGAKERLEKRAAKFGAPVPVEVKKLVRAERFGLANSTQPSAAAMPVKVDGSTLKKRTERFGAVVGSVAEKVDLEERKRKRLERFGAVTINTTGSVKLNSSSEAEERKKLRAERFKTN